MSTRSLVARAGVLVSLLVLPMPAGAWSDDMFEGYLQAGKWPASTDDNASGEAWPLPVVETIVRRYCEAPTNADASENLGIVALTVGAANWGIFESGGLPDDPNNRQWRSTTGADAGKHVMAYAIGGVGISHADVGDLHKFLLELAGRNALPEARRAGLRKLASEVKYRKHDLNKAVVYDEVRAAGVCRNPKFDTDLDGEPFNHRPQSAKASYCAKRSNNAIGPDDWRLFRTVVRQALRRKEDQAWLLRFWMDNYWKDSVARVHKGPGYTEEVIVNARIRNSGSGVADKAIAPAGSSPAQRIAHEFKVYGKDDPGRLERRRGTMMRPVVLYRHIAAKLRNAGVPCP